jgi:phospholipid N-methyltransferase
MASLQEAALSVLSNSRTTRQTLLFARNFLKHPLQLGSVVPSSRFLVNQLLAPVDWERARVVVEYGPGVGNITREILRRMRRDATMVAIELNSDFVDFLRMEVDDPRLRVVHGSASDALQTLRAMKLPRVDYIISCIPYSTIPDTLRAEIVKQSRELLVEDGAMLMFQFTRVVVPHLKTHFGFVEQGFTPLNILPAHIFHCRV